MIRYVGDFRNLLPDRAKNCRQNMSTETSLTNIGVFNNTATSILVTDVGDEISW